MIWGLHIGEIWRSLARISPVAGLALIASSLLTDTTNSWNGVWHIALSVVLGIFVTLVGMLYHNLENRMKGLEESRLTRREFQIATEATRSQLDRMEEHLRAIDLRDSNRDRDNRNRGDRLDRGGR